MTCEKIYPLHSDARQDFTEATPPEVDDAMPCHASNFVRVQQTNPTLQADEKHVAFVKVLLRSIESC